MKLLKPIIVFVVSLLTVTAILFSMSLSPENHFEAVAEAQAASGQGQISQSAPSSNDITTTAVASSNNGQYTVQSGDSLYAIAKKYSVSVNDLIKVNHLQSTTIQPGQTLIIPGSDSANYGTYTVKSGDSLYSIANAYGTTVSQLKTINSLATYTIYVGQKLKVPPTKQSSLDNLPLKTILAEKGLVVPGHKFVLYVNKSAKTLSVLLDGIYLKSYHVELGDSGSGDKAISGDHKTPEGTFYVAEKSVLTPPDEFLGTRWMRLSYPNIEDANRGLQQGLIDQTTHDNIVTAITNLNIPPQQTALGGGVGIHGGSTPALGTNWTWGCVGLTDKDVEDFYNFVSVGTPVIIVS